MSKFKAGDRVKQIEHHSSISSAYATVIKVTEELGKTVVYHKHDGSSVITHVIGEECFELITGDWDE